MAQRREIPVWDETDSDHEARRVVSLVLNRVADEGEWSDDDVDEILDFFWPTGGRD